MKLATRGFDLFLYPKESLSEMDIALANNIQRWAESEVDDKRLEHQEDYDALLKPALAALSVDIGLQKMLWPEAHGGEEHNTPEVAMTLAASLEQVGRADTGLGYLLSNLIALQSTIALAKNLNPEACAALAPLFGGRQPVFPSLILPAYGEAGSPDAFMGKNLQATARLGAQGWVLNGMDMRTTCCGGVADIYGVLCAVEGSDEVAFILVPGKTKGIGRQEVFKKMGLAASRNADVAFRDVNVPESCCAFRGIERYREMLSWYYLGISATCAGSLLATYEIIKNWGDTRIIKGDTFKENPLTAALMAEIAKEAGLSRMLAYNLAAMLARPELYGDAGSEGVYTTALMIVDHITHSAEKATHNTMELMASAGYAKEWQLERYWRDVKTVQLYLGAHELAKMDMARYFYSCQTL